MELCLNLTVNVWNGVNERMGADFEAAILCAAYKFSEDRQITVFVFIRDSIVLLLLL
jgi:hypothetical protein